jgi:hypothetical protein
MASLALRVARIEAALGHVAEPPAWLVFIGADGIPRTGDGVVVDLDATPPGTRLVIVSRQVPAGPRPAVDDPHTE